MPFALLPLVLFAQTAAVAVPADIVSPDPKAMSSAEIKTFNAKLPRSHPYYIRCVKTAAVGSLVARQVSCRTNEQWKLTDLRGNQNARDTVEAMQGKAVNSSN